MVTENYATWAEFWLGFRGEPAVGSAMGRVHCIIWQVEVKDASLYPEGIWWLVFGLEKL